jgi:hypothetical protein
VTPPYFVNFGVPDKSLGLVRALPDRGDNPKPIRTLLKSLPTQGCSPGREQLRD